MSNYKDLTDYLANFHVNMNVAGPLLNKLIYNHPTITKHNEYLYELYYDTIDYAGAKTYIESLYLPKIGGCSSFCKDGFYGRNYDWYYDNTVSFVIHVPATATRHASVGVSSSMNMITTTTMSNEEYNAMFDYAPCLILDGINDAGVTCNINVVPHDDYEPTIGTNPNGEPLCATMIPRYVLDNADTAADAIALLSNYNIYCPHGKEISEEIHVMISDGTDSYCVEFINNEMKVIDFADVSLNPIMTNFYIYGFDGNTATAYYNDTDYDADTTTLTPHAMGLERYDILKAEFSKTSTYTLNDAIAAMKSIRYTKAYSALNDPIWYSELSAKYPSGADLTIDSPVIDYMGAFTTMQEYFENRTRDVKNTWQTVHTSVYDIDNLKLYVLAQEQDTQYSFDI